MSDELAIVVKNVGKRFRLPHQRMGSFKNLILNFYRQPNFEWQTALEDVSFEVKKGEFFGVIGRNGSGKSTLLKLLAGIYLPDKGHVQVNGKLTPFIELGVGFNPELTGRENVFLNGALLGFSHKEMRAMYKDIVDFAELERFMDQKLKNYSSGMQVRLAFSVAIKVNSDILLLDEVLAVGDADFQKKCFDYFRKLKKDKQTVVFISHDMDAIKEYCDRVVMLEEGLIVESGKPDPVVREYSKLFFGGTDVTESKDEEVEGGKKRWGNGMARLNKVRISQTKDEVLITQEGKFFADVEEPVFGLQITNPLGIRIVETNTKWEKIPIGNIKKGQKLVVQWRVDNIFTNGTQTVSSAISSHNGLDFYDSWEDAAEFVVDKDKVTTALALPRIAIDIKREK